MTTEFAVRDQGAYSRVEGSAVFVRVAELGAALAPGAAYRCNNTPVPLICAQGHACSPQPTNVIQGHGICGECIASFDRVYLLRHLHRVQPRAHETHAPPMPSRNPHKHGRALHPAISGSGLLSVWLTLSVSDSQAACAVVL